MGHLIKIEKLAIKIAEDFDLSTLIADCNLMSDLTQAYWSKLSIIRGLQLFFNRAWFQPDVRDLAVKVNTSYTIWNWDVNHVYDTIFEGLVSAHSEWNGDDTDFFETLKFPKVP